MTDLILRSTYMQIRPHAKQGQTEFETLCRLIYKSIHGQDPDFRVKQPSKYIRVDEGDVSSENQERTVGELYLFKQSMSYGHNRMNPHPQGVDNPIVIVKFMDYERLIDGSNRINYWFAQGDLGKKLMVNLHTIK